VGDRQKLFVVRRLYDDLGSKLCRIRKLNNNTHFDGFHPLDGNSVAPGQEQQKLLLVLQRHLVYHLPKPPDRLVRRTVTVFVLGRVLEGRPVVIFIAHDHRHQLVRVEELENSSTAHSHEAFVKRCVLFLDGGVENVIDVEIDVLLSGIEKLDESECASCRCNSHLLSCVTGIFEPLGFNSTTFSSPKTFLLSSKNSENVSCRSVAV
jgi:hypothetical protein